MMRDSEHIAHFASRKRWSLVQTLIELVRQGL